MWILSVYKTSPPDNRLRTDFCQALLLALDIVEQRYPPAVLITTSGIPKFYSNGLDLEHGTYTPHFFTESLYAVWRRLLCYPMPTVALLNGHAFAGALMTAMYCDYRIMNPHKGYLCLNEVELGAPLRPPMTSIFREKMAPHVYRKTALEAHRFKALDALKEGVVDALGRLPETLSFIDELKLVSKAQSGMSGRSVYIELKREMYRQSLQLLESFGEEDGREFARIAAERRDREAGERRIREWEGKAKAKL
ncbi:ClpP/crotonase [Teratosphaeria nubilosa]|uniref:ClpP/crotonase n=1 Tax=Teratosphaeria nubilosa TaxID=161662 RepID=A0A6G1LEP2_9PEZI|nr:ClpP/crotonase [Teratosphaeria nubilosa]